MGLNVNVSVPFLEKLLEYAVSGIGSVAGAMLAPWKARQESRADNILARGEAQTRQIRAEGDAKALHTITAAQAEARRMYELPVSSQGSESSIVEAVDQRIRFQEEKRQRNIYTVLEKAASNITSTEVPDEEPNHDWTARFFNSVQDVSSDEMQTLWAKILAGEVEQPGSTSARTLSILRDLDQATATDFQRLCSMAIHMQLPKDTTVVEGAEGAEQTPIPETMRHTIEHYSLASLVPSLGYLPSTLRGGEADRELHTYAISSNKLRFLNEHGLIDSNFYSSMDFSACVLIRDSRTSRWVRRLEIAYQGKSRVLIPMGEPDPSQNVVVSGVLLTLAGKQLSKVIETEPLPAFDRVLTEYFNNEHQLTFALR